MHAFVHIEVVVVVVEMVVVVVVLGRIMFTRPWCFPCNPPIIRGGEDNLKITDQQSCTWYFATSMGIIL